MTRIEPITEVIPRRGRGTQPDGDAELPPADWEMVSGELRKGSATSWLATVGRDGSPHVRPVFAAWTGSSFVVASKHDAVKSRNMRADGRATITTDIGFLHVVVEGLAQRVTDRERLQLASRTMQEVFAWPTEVVGEELDARVRGAHLRRAAVRGLRDASAEGVRIPDAGHLRAHAVEFSSPLSVTAGRAPGR
ncbi:pyridoxamine 5'-phosphate oxidase family protein [Streptomyces sp. CA-251247]|uniref:pyridoxamine 5'-phosphate oxidase family protein n=1 Tax=Streptomyces sp. CA-251247 TaxID=3240062 RepID=UPI003D908D63